jgi:hypothetical protein
MIAFCGHSRSGKDAAAFMFSQITGLKYAGSLSWLHKDIVAEKLGVPDQTAWDNRHINRMEWRRILDEYKQGDESKLVKRSLEFGKIVSGIRKFSELQAATAEGLIKISVWIDRPGIEIDPTITYTSSSCTHVISNTGSLSYLNDQLVLLAESVNGLMV